MNIRRDVRDLLSIESNGEKNQERRTTIESCILLLLLLVKLYCIEIVRVWEIVSDWNRTIEESVVTGTLREKERERMIFSIFTAKWNFYLFIGGEGKVSKRNSGNKSEGDTGMIRRAKEKFLVPCKFDRQELDSTGREAWLWPPPPPPTARLISSRYVVVGMVAPARNSRKLLEIHRTSRPATRDPTMHPTKSRSRTFVSMKLKTRFRLRFREIQSRLNHPGAGGNFLRNVWEIGRVYRMYNQPPSNPSNNFQVARQISRIRFLINRISPLVSNL